MDWDEPTLSKKPQPKDLAPLGVAQLEEYIATLEAEITRAKAEIGKRQNSRSSAEALFRK